MPQWLVWIAAGNCCGLYDMLPSSGFLRHYNPLKISSAHQLIWGLNKKTSSLFTHFKDQHRPRINILPILTHTASIEQFHSEDSFVKAVHSVNNNISWPESYSRRFLQCGSHFVGLVARLLFVWLRPPNCNFFFCQEDLRPLLPSNPFYYVLRLQSSICFLFLENRQNNTNFSGFRPVSLLWWDVWGNVSVQVSSTADLHPLWGQNQILRQSGSRSCET